MDVKDAILKRRSIRKFSDRDVAMDILGDIMETVKMAPSAGNLQNWKFIIVKERKTKEKIAELCYDQDWIADVPVLIVICNDYKTIVDQYGKDGKLFSIQNCAIIGAYITLLAKNKGLDTCWIGGFKLDELAETLKIPGNVDPEAIIALGYGKERPKIPPRIEISKTTFFEKWKGKAKFEPPTIKESIRKITKKKKPKKKKSLLQKIINKR